MATGSFRPSRERRPTVTFEDRKPQVNVLVPDSGMEFIDSAIPSERAGQLTEFRVLNSFTDGQEDLPPLNPDATEGMSLEQAVGAWAYPVKMISKCGSTNVTMPVETWTGRNGSVVDDNWTVADVILNKLRKRLKTAAEIIKREGPHASSHDLPQAWLPWVGKWVDGTFKEWWSMRCPIPSEMVLVQAIFKQIAGEPCLDIHTGQPSWKTNAVMALPKGSTVKFFVDLLKRRNPHLPLTVDNNMAGDPVTCATGCCLCLSKHSKAASAVVHGAQQKKSSNPQSAWEYSLTVDRQPTPLDPAFVRQVWRPWDQLIVTVTIEDVIEKLAEAFSWAAVVWALEGSKYQDYVPEKIRQVALAELGAQTPQPHVAPISMHTAPPPPVVQQAPVGAPPPPPSLPAAYAAPALPAAPAAVRQAAPPPPPALAPTMPSMPSMPSMPAAPAPAVKPSVPGAPRLAPPPASMPMAANMPGVALPGAIDPNAINKAKSMRAPSFTPPPRTAPAPAQTFAQPMLNANDMAQYQRTLAELQSQVSVEGVDELPDDSEGNEE